MIEVYISSRETSERRSRSAEPRSPLSEVTEDRRHSVNSNTPAFPPTPPAPRAAAATVDEKRRRKPGLLASDADEVSHMVLVLFVVSRVPLRAFCYMPLFAAFFP